jgi:AraC-like DNA-binding protein
VIDYKLAMEINKVNTYKLPIFDGLEVKSATFIDKAFPLHFHQSWSLAFIASGSENISFSDVDFLLHKNALVLIPPYSLHKNWGNKNNLWSYKAIYIGDDQIKSLTEKLNLDYAFLASCPYFVSYFNRPFDLNEQSISDMLETLFLSSINDNVVFESRIDTFEQEVLNHLSLNYKTTITLEALEKKFKVNKFKLLKGFKKKIGLTPLEYQTAIRIENAKQLFYSDISLAHIALESGFYDQSHFTHSFKKYVGVTPGSYKRNSNILQDL